MKTKSTVGRLITHLSKCRKSAARVAAMLLLLCTTAIPAWADNYAKTWNDMITDDGGGEVRFRGHNYDVLGSNWSISYYGFKTNKTFNPANDQFYWEFNMFVDYGYYIAGGFEYWNNTAYKGDIYVMTPDSQAHSIAHWEREKCCYGCLADVNNTSYNITDSTWGYIYVSQMPQNDITIQYMPTSRAFEDGVKCIMMKESASEA
ncbi:MAG: hypothetical protein IKN59_07315, partial [Paludibacteraceae bacterium]|nr:hypothetical protein [Paludibacteraceae bacterium]